VSCQGKKQRAQREEVYHRATVHDAAGKTLKVVSRAEKLDNRDAPRRKEDDDAVK
jgi:hypothetical protein